MLRHGNASAHRVVPLPLGVVVVGIPLAVITASPGEVQFTPRGSQCRSPPPVSLPPVIFSSPDWGCRWHSVGTGQLAAVDVDHRVVFCAIAHDGGAACLDARPLIDREGGGSTLLAGSMMETPIAPYVSSLSSPLGRSRSTVPASRVSVPPSDTSTTLL